MVPDFKGKAYLQDFQIMIQSLLVKCEKIKIWPHTNNDLALYDKQDSCNSYQKYHILDTVL